MNKELQKLQTMLEKAVGDEQRKLYVEFCSKLVEMVQEGKIREEEAAYDMIEYSPKNFDEWPEVAAIFDAAADAELPREVSYTQPMGDWNSKTADEKKEKEWKKVLAAVKNAKVRYG